MNGSESNSAKTFKEMEKSVKHLLLLVLDEILMVALATMARRDGTLSED